MSNMKYMENKEPIKYSPYELNILISLLLSDLVGSGVVSERQGELAKIVFNDLMDLIVNNKEVADALIEEGERLSEEIKEDFMDSIEEEAWDIISAAERVRDDTLMS